MSGDQNGAVGQSVLRREDEYLLRGQGRFVDDLPTPLNTLHLAFVLSPYAHARITLDRHERSNGARGRGRRAPPEQTSQPW